MNENIIDFFDRKDVKRTLNEYISNSNIDLNNNYEDVKKTTLQHSVYIAKFILSDPKVWSENCKTTIRSSGSFLLNILNDLDNSKEDKNEIIYSIFFELLCEHTFRKNDYSSYLNDLKHYAANNVGNFSYQLRSKIIYSLYAMPSKLMQELIASNEFILLRDFVENKEIIDKTNEILREKISILSKKIQEVNALDARIEDQRSTYNFVGLNKGFQDLESKKKKESNVNLIVLSLISLFMIAIPLIISLLYFLANDPESLLFLMPILSLELILIYFFRVVLVRFKEIKTQIMQLELRQALCQFIENYADYSTDIKAKDSAALEKFENLIFSGITTNPENIPSTFDGIDQIARLIQSIKSSK